MIKYLIEKEFKQIKRNPFLPKLIMMFPVLVMLVFPWVASLDVKDINLCVIDNDHSTYSKRLVHKASSSGYFRITHVADTYGEAIESMERSKSDIILEIAHGFESNLIKEKRAEVMIVANAVNGTKGGLSSSYLARIVGDFTAEIGSEFGGQSQRGGGIIEIIPQYRFNPYLDYKAYIIPALMVVLLTVLCGFLPALNIVSEKEKGTIEQINVTPVSKFVFILAKLIPYWIIGFGVLTVCFGLAALIYGLVPVGSIATIYLFAMIFVLIFSGFGLVISNHSANMQQAMFVMFFFAIIMILMGGIFTPVSSMPAWAQTITIFNPLRYFIQVMRAVYLKGSDVWALKTELIALICFAVVFIGWAMISYRKKA